MEPLVFAVLAGCSPVECECQLYDERLEEIPAELNVDLVAITVETFTARRAYQLAVRFENQGIPVVLGGYHATFRPSEALQYAGTVVIGDAEDVWPQVVADARLGRLKRVYRGAYPDLAQRRVDRRIFRGKRYRPVALVQFGRGCRYSCDFCSIHAFYGTNLRWRPVADVIAEFETIDRPYVFLTDDNLFNDTDHLLKLLDAMRPLRLRWSCQCSIDVAANDHLVRAMANSGCISMMIGFESLDSNNLRLMRKSWNQKYGSYTDSITRLRDHGIMIYGGFVLGYDHDTPDVFDKTLEFAIENRLFLANFNPLAPTPGARLYDRLHEEGRLIRDPWWLNAQFRYGDSLFHPRQMTADQLSDGCYRIRTEFNRWNSIVRRACDWRANFRTPMNAAAYMLANFTSRREIHRKQGRPLGDPNVELRPIYSKEREPMMECVS